jgi:hypothetical protein
MSGKIFISYRRGDDAGFAGRLFDSLSDAFGPDELFIDVDNIEPGEDFLKVLEDKVAQADILLAVIGSRWIDALDSQGKRRLESPTDFVRIEIEAALNQKKRVIPVLVGEVEMPAPEQLPESLRMLPRRHAYRLKHERFRSDAKGLIEALKKIMSNPASRPALNAKGADERLRLVAEALERHIVEPPEGRNAESPPPASQPNKPVTMLRAASNEHPQPPPRPSPLSDTDKKRRVVRTDAEFPFKSAIALGLVLILAGAALVWRAKLVSEVSGLFTSSFQRVELPVDTSLAPRPKLANPVGQPSASDQVAPVAQRVVLYDEDPAEPTGKQYVGSAVWRTEQVKGAAGKPDDLAVRADIDIPDRKFKMTMSFRRNTDTSLPASHTAELTFILPTDFVGGGVGNVPGILMKSNEQARGTPLAGLAVKVTDGFFLVGLSNVDTDRTRNLQLLKERSWFDVPLVYTNQRRAIIAIEKGSPGEHAFNDAFAAWGD